MVLRDLESETTAISQSTLKKTKSALEDEKQKAEDVLVVVACAHRLTAS